MAVVSVEPHKSSLGDLDANIVALIAYVAAGVIGWIPYLKYVAWLAPLVIFFLEKKSGFVRFHAMQAFILNAISAVLSFLLVVVIGGIAMGSMNTVGNVYAAAGTVLLLGTIATIIGVIITIFAIIALVNALQYKTYRIPVIGNLADKFSNKKVM